MAAQLQAAQILVLMKIIFTSSGFPYITGSITVRAPICAGSEAVAVAVGTDVVSTLVSLETGPADGLIPVMPTAAGTNLIGGIPAEDPAHIYRSRETRVCTTFQIFWMTAIAFDGIKCQ